MGAEVDSGKQVGRPYLDEVCENSFPSTDVSPFQVELSVLFPVSFFLCWSKGREFPPHPSRIAQCDCDLPQARSF